jgi:glycosyltransferase involved in cell wall biosynthesis
VNKVLVLDRETVEVSVIMATYNPSWEKCVFTLDSVIGQKDMNFELIIVDDGSSDNLFSAYEIYFSNIGFSRFKLIDHKENQGTVKNYTDGLKAAEGKYIKLISPGDALFNDNSLSDWLSALKASGRTWSFADAIYYSVADDKPRIMKSTAVPRLIDCYLDHDSPKCRWNYTVLEDIPLGAAILCERDVFGSYLDQITGHVIYSEDLSYVLMMFDGIEPFYYDVPCIFYEYGCGVSTVNDKIWRDRFHNDLISVETIITNRTCCDELQTKIQKALVAINSGNNAKKRLVKNTQKGGIEKVIKYRLNPRMSGTDISLCGKWWNEYAAD